MYAFCDLTTILIINIVVRSQKLSENSQLVRATSYQLGFFNFVKTEKNLIRFDYLALKLRKYESHIGELWSEELNEG